MAEVVFENKSEEQVRREWGEEQENHLSRIREALRNYDISPAIFLANAAAGICGVDLDVLRNSKFGIGGASHARWLFLYSYRMMTNDTYAEMVKVVGDMGMSFSLDGIRKAVDLMGQLIRTEVKWKRRWIEMQKVINIITETK